MTEAVAIAPEEPAYAARSVIATALPEALSLRALYYAVQNGELAPVHYLQRPETDYYLEKIGDLSRAMDEAIRTAGGLIICHEEEEEERSETNEVSSIQITQSRIKGSYFQVSRGVLLGFVANAGNEQAIGFGPENIVTSDGDYQPRELLYEPSGDAIREMDMRKRQEFLDQIRKQHRRATTNLRRIK